MHLTPNARQIALALAAPCFLAATTANALEWFPRHPGTLDQLYLVERNNCDEGRQVPWDDLVLTVLDANKGIVELSGTYSVSVCPLPPPWDAYVAVPIPAKLGHVTLRELVVRLTSPLHPDDPSFEYSLRVPQRVGIPPSIAGTWFGPDSAEQGFLFNVSTNPTGGTDLVVSYNTYGADGTQRWHSGAAPIDATATQVNVTLTDTGTGVFGGTATTPDEVRTWGNIDVRYFGCGDVEVSMQPAPYTGLANSHDPLVQVTRSHGDPCDLDAWMQQIGGRYFTVDAPLEQLPEEP